MKKPVLIFVVSILVITAVAVVIGMSLGQDRATPEPDGPMGRQTGSTGLPWLNGEQKPTNLTPATHPQGPVTDSPLLPIGPQTADAAETMRNAMKNGDPMAPPIYRDPTPVEQATPEEIADPRKYDAYLARQNTRLYKQYVQAADAEIPRLQQDIAKAKAMGLKPEQIAEGEEKLRRIQQMRDQLAAEHPEIRN